MTWTSLTFAYGSTLTSTKMTQLYDNITATANGDSGSPNIQTAAIAAGAVTYSKCAFSNNIVAGDLAPGSVGVSEILGSSVHQDELSTSLQQSSATNSATITFTGGAYSLAWGLADSNNISADFTVTSMITGTTYAWGIGISGTGTYYFQSTYINASPPYDLGFGHCHDFIYLLLDNNGEIAGYDLANAPPWVYNGPTKVTGKHCKDGKQYIKQLVLPPNLANFNKSSASKDRLISYLDELAEYKKNPTYEEIELTPEMKNADMDLIPNPWPGSDKNIVLLDPTCDLAYKLTTLRGDGFLEDVGNDILYKQLIKVNNNPLNKKGPAGLPIVQAKWKNTN